MMNFLSLFVLFSFFLHNDATRCFECRNIANPLGCTTIRECNSDEYCSTEQIVTASGNVRYNTGCRSKLKCSAASGLIIGKRSANITKRSSGDLSTCIECCLGDFCNNHGCGTPAHLGQRGPYCFNCGTVLDPKTCRDVALCDINEKCLLYSPAEFSGLTDTVYRSQCENRAACDVLSQVVHNHKCPPSCCDTDFCNDECGSSPKTTPFYIPIQPGTQTTTQKPIVVTSPQQPVVVTSHASCKQDHYYDDITGMCIKIDETRVLDHDQAVKACEAIGDQLVTIDSHEKTVFVENMILKHSHLFVLQRNYYIAALDKYNNNVFYWPNGHQMYYTNWGGGDEIAANKQPDYVSLQPQSCVLLFGTDHYRWHNDRCVHQRHFICEDRSTLHTNIVHQTGTPYTTRVPSPTHHSNTFHCNAHDGYMLLQGEGTHLCVYIVTHHADWDSARAACKNDGGDLVVLDTTVKAKLMRQTVNGHSYSGQSGYWIGAKDFNSNNNFSWVNGHSVTHGDWHPGQPNHHDGGHDQNCVCLWSSSEHFQWYDDYCPKGLGYICERK